MYIAPEQTAAHLSLLGPGVYLNLLCSEHKAIQYTKRSLKYLPGREEAKFFTQGPSANKYCKL